jgi:hypothetical protein
MAGCNFALASVNSQLALLGLPQSTPLSVLAVEVPPGEQRVVTAPPDEDPLGVQLGKRRILRTSPLVSVPSVC